MTGCKPSNTPKEFNSKLGKVKEGVPMDKGQYQRLVGKLIYLCHTRPNISFVVSMINQFMHALYERCMEAVYRILKYLKGTLGEGLFSKRMIKKEI